MPSFLRPDGKPVVELDPAIEMSPFVLFRRLRERRPLQLVDVRSEPGEWTLEGAEKAPEENWRPAVDNLDVVLFDEDGVLAVDRAQALQAAGFPRARALFGGLQLYAFALDPEVVGDETYLQRVVAD